MTLYHHLGMEARHLPTTCEAWQKSWMRRPPSVASAPEKSNDASRARSARPRHGPHSCAMTAPTRSHWPGSLEPPAFEGLTIRKDPGCAGVLEAGELRCGRPRGSAVPKPPEAPSPILGVREASGRSSRSPQSPATRRGSPPGQSRPHLPKLSGRLGQWRTLGSS